MLFNLFQSLFLHLLTNKFNLYDFKCGILIKVQFTPEYKALFNAIYTSVWYFCYFCYMLRAKLDCCEWKVLITSSQFFFYTHEMILHQCTKFYERYFLLQTTKYGTACVANISNVLMRDSVNYFIWCLWTKCVFIWMNLLYFVLLSKLHLSHDFSNGCCV